MPDYPIPPSVLQNAEKRLAAASAFTRRPCRTPDCDQPATHWPATRSPACETHRVVPAPPIPDQLMSEPHLRATRGSRATPARTVFDNVVEAKGQRVGAARRKALR